MTTDQLAKMTPEEKRIKIAELCGFRRIHRDPQVYDPSGRLLFGVDRDGYEMDVPDYLNSLDSMAEAESQCIYRDGAESDLAFDYLSNLVIKAEAGRAHSASASQRADAFLLTMLP